MSVGSVESVKETEVKEIPVIPRISPRTLPGVLTSANKGAIDWGWQSYLAYGCQNHVVVIDTSNVKVFQTLHNHRADVNKVKWAKASNFHNSSSPYALNLASADISGNITVWDVVEAEAISSFSENSKPVLEIEWLTGQDACYHLLVALHPPYSVIVWDTKKGEKVWKKSYTETLLSFAFDPFLENRMAFLASDCILFVDDFSFTKVPSTNGRKFYISNPSASATANAQMQGNSWGSESRNRSIIPKRMRFLIRADSKLNEDGVTLQECLQLSYHRSYRQHLLLLYPREILVLDLDINQTVGIVSVDQCSANIMHMYSCWQRDAFYILQENGCLSFRLRHRGQRVMAAATPSFNTVDTAFNFSDLPLEVSYDLYSQSDSLRLTKHAKVLGIAVCPKSESKISLLISDGRLLFFDLIITQKKPSNADYWAPHLRSILPKLDGDNQFPFPVAGVHPGDVLSDHIPPALYPSSKHASSFKDAAKFKLFIVGHLSALSSPPHVIRMCPPVTFRNWKEYQPLMAVGNAAGSIQVIDMATGMMKREFTVHAFPVRGIEWMSLTSFLSYAHTNTVNSFGHVRNEVVLTDIQSGRTKALRAEHQEESPIEMIRVSCLKQYLIIAFKDEPLELWDLRLLTLLRTMSKNFPSITALEWSPVHKKTQSSWDLTMDRLKDPVTAEFAAESDVIAKSLTYKKEHFVFTDTNGQLHHFSVEGNVIQDGAIIPADPGVESITSIAWKGDYIVLGYVDGNINVLNSKEKYSKGMITHRGWIKKIRFGPGKGNLKAIVQFNDGVDVWDFKNRVRVESIKCPRDMPKIRDIDWAGSDRPCIATSDGCVRITDIKIKLSTSPLKDYEPTEAFLNPYMMPTTSVFTLKSYLQHIDAECFVVDRRLKMQVGALDSDVVEFLKTCPFGSAERSLHISRLFGDEEGCHFWTIALFYLKEAKSKLIQKSSDNGRDEDSTSESPFFQQPLDTGFDILCDNETFKKLQLEKVSLHLQKRTAYAQTQQCVERLLLLGQLEKSVQLLLETDTTNKNFYIDCLKACLTATIQASGTSLSIVKLVSTNLIASGHIMEGVQLLCLIEKGLDACKYLLGAERWEEAVWLAKSTLPMPECCEILKRWVDYLFSNNQKNKGLLILLTMHQFWKVIQILQSSNMVERAAILLDACLQFGLVSETDENSDEINKIFQEYDQYLRTLFETTDVTDHKGYNWRKQNAKTEKQ